MQRLGELDLKALICFRTLASSSINCANLIELNQLVTFMCFFFMTSPSSIIDNAANKEYNIKLSLCERFWWSQCPHRFPTRDGNQP